MADDEAGPFVTVADGRTSSWRKKNRISVLKRKWPPERGNFLEEGRKVHQWVVSVRVNSETQSDLDKNFFFLNSKCHWLACDPQRKVSTLTNHQRNVGAGSGRSWCYWFASTQYNKLRSIGSWAIRMPTRSIPPRNYSIIRFIKRQASVRSSKPFGSKNEKFRCESKATNNGGAHLIKQLFDSAYIGCNGASNRRRMDRRVWYLPFSGIGLLANETHCHLIWLLWPKQRRFVGQHRVSAHLKLSMSVDSIMRRSTRQEHDTRTLFLSFFFIPSTWQL